MKILATTDLTRNGNDCLIYESITLAEEFGMYLVIETEMVTGWCPDDAISIQSYTTDDLDDAKRRYKEHGGKIR